MSKQTPEGVVKDAVKTYLNMIGCISASKAPLVSPAHHGYYFMPGGTGFGTAGIPDFVGHYKGRFFAIETKVEGKNPTSLQQHQIKAINTTKGDAFIIRGVYDLDEFTNWVISVDKQF